MNYLVASSSIAILVLLLWNPISSHQIIQNEQELLGTCQRNCDKMPTLYDKLGCKKIDRCKQSSKGPNKGIYRCDYCECSCEANVASKDVVVSNTKLSITEPDLYDTCTVKCDSNPGLVRTDFKGCSEVRNCKREKKGWIRGFVRCDYCTCDCIKKKYASKYTLENVRYDLSETAIKQGAPLAMGQTTAENHSRHPQKVIRTLSFTYVTEASTTTSHALQVGLSVTVEGSVTAGVATLTTSVQRSIEYGYSYTAGKTESKQHSDQLTAETVVPGESSIKALVIAHKMNIDIPYSATLVTEYEDGSKSRKHITGVYSNVDFADFKVQYEKARHL